MSTVATRCDGNRRGFTLLEVVLVLAIIVAVGAVAAPIFQGTLRGERLRKGVELISIDWTRTRAKAMEMGETQVWLCELSDGSYSSSVYSGVQGLSPSDAASLVSASTGLSSSDASSGSFGQSAMPDGVSISDVLISDADTVVMMSQSTNSMESGSATIFFYPDGTSSSARLTVTNEEEQTMSVMLNGLSGTIRVARGESQ